MNIHDLIGMYAVTWVFIVSLNDSYTFLISSLTASTIEMVFITDQLYKFQLNVK